MTRECRVRFCERLRGQFLWPTHHFGMKAHIGADAESPRLCAGLPASSPRGTPGHDLHGPADGADRAGVPLEIYCFTSTTVWAKYERIEGDIFDYLLAVLPEFGAFRAGSRR